MAIASEELVARFLRDARAILGGAEKEAAGPGEALPPGRSSVEKEAGRSSLEKEAGPSVEPDEAGLRSLGDLLRQLAAESAAVATRDLATLHGTSAAARVIGSEGPEGLTLMLARFPETESTPVHDHGSWGVACVVRGRDRYTAWDRLDDGSDPARAEVRVREERELGAGDIVWWQGPPRDIHSQQGVGEPAIELVLFGRDTTKVPRHYFDPATGRVRTALPQ